MPGAVPVARLDVRHRHMCNAAGQTVKFSYWRGASRDLWQRCLMQQSSGSGDIILFDSASGEGQGQAAVIGA